jgi:sulfate permease, SulP family
VTIGPQWKREVLFFPTLRGYQRRWLSRDLLAGVTFGAVTIPGQIATAHLAGMPPITGLYGFLAACVLAALVAANRHIALGVDSTVAPMLAGGLAGLGLIDQSQQYVGLAILTTLMVGILILVVGIGNMGWFGDFLSKPVVIGFLGGIAIIIVVDQLPGMFGLAPESGRTVSRLMQFVEHLDLTNVPTLAVGVVSLVLLLGIARFSRRIPGALIVLVLATTAVTVLDLTADGVAVLGPLQKGLPSIAFPEVTWEGLELVTGTALAITLICLAQTSATSRSSAAIGGFETDINADYRALGAANVLSSFFGAFTVDASPPSTTIISESRGRTQLVSIVAAVMVVVLLFASDLAQNLPTATLSAVLIYIAIKIFRVDQMRATWRYSWRAFTLMLMTMFGLVFFGIVYGVALAVLVSFADRTRRTARPELLKLGRTSHGQWLPALDDRATPPGGVAAFLLNGPLWFGNANWFRLEMIGAIPEGPNKPRLLVLDTTRMDDIDFTGADALAEIAEICELRTVTFALASHIGRTEAAFIHGGLMDLLGPDRFFDSVEAAVSALGPPSRTPS